MKLYLSRQEDIHILFNALLICNLYLNLRLVSCFLCDDREFDFFASTQARSPGRNKEVTRTELRGKIQLPHRSSDMLPNSGLRSTLRESSNVPLSVWFSSEAVLRGHCWLKSSAEETWRGWDYSMSSGVERFQSKGHEITLDLGWLGLSSGSKQVQFGGVVVWIMGILELRLATLGKGCMWMHSGSKWAQVGSALQVFSSHYKKVTTLLEWSLWARPECSSPSFCTQPISQVRKLGLREYHAQVQGSCSDPVSTPWGLQKVPIHGFTFCHGTEPMAT